MESTPLAGSIREAESFPPQVRGVQDDLNTARGIPITSVISPMAAEGSC